MITKEIKEYLSLISDDLHMVNKLIIAAYLEFNNIQVINNKLILSHLEGNDKKKINEFVGLLKKKSDTFDFEDLIHLFEITIPSGDVVVNGAVYTPGYIKKYIVDSALAKIKKLDYMNIRVADIACGSGAFLYTVAEVIKQNTDKTFFEIFKDNIFGLDISDYAIDRAETLLTLLAITQGEDIEQFHFNLFVGNALKFDWIKKIPSFSGFDTIVGNPPYVRTKHIDAKTKLLMKRWKVAQSGNSDLYIPFFEIGVKYLRENGILGYITVNTFKRSVNARNLRNYFEKELLDLTMLDFGNHQVFGNKLTYTSIVYVQKRKSVSMKYKKISPDTIEEDKNIEFSEIPYNSLDSKKGWLLGENEILKNIHIIEKTGIPLGEKVKIRNGLATLSNSVFIFKAVREDDTYYYLSLNNQEYKVEKSICRDVIKPNRLKNEKQIKALTEKIIFPYHMDSSKNLTVFEEDHFKTNYPKAYHYLGLHKTQLLGRDKGKPKKYKWFEFGRSQSLKDYGKKLLFPYMADKPYYVYTSDINLMFYAGYAIYSESSRELKILKKILESSVFWYYIKNTSKPYSSNYYAFAKNYVKDFGVCLLSKEEEDKLLKMKDKDKINAFLVDKYEISV